MGQTLKLSKAKQKKTILFQVLSARAYDDGERKKRSEGKNIKLFKTKIKICLVLEVKISTLNGRGHHFRFFVVFFINKIHVFSWLNLCSGIP